MKHLLGDAAGSIRVKLLAINLVTIGGVLLLVTALLIGHAYVSGRAAMLGDLRVQAGMIAANSTAAVAFSDGGAAEEILAALRASPSVSAAALYDADRNLFARYHRDAGRAPPPEASAAGYLFSALHLDLSQPVVLDGREIATLSVRADMLPLYRRLLMYAVTVAGLAALALAIGSWVLNRLQRRITSPIVHLAELSRKVSHERDYSVRSVITSQDEIGNLAHSFNEMLAQIQSRETELKRELCERRRAEERLDRLARYDTVTGLPNRHYFNERLSLAVEKSMRFGEVTALMFLDLDNFKIVNDTLGHHVGDMLLRVVAQRLHAALRHGDTICRVGGDEFAVILENLSDMTQAPAVAEKCIRALAVPVDVDGNEIYVSVSIGISSSPNDTVDMHELLKNADTAMYHAKAKGKNTHQVFLPEMQGKAQKRLTLETNLRRGLERGEFLLHYQPQIELGTNRVIGVEALIRWNHPDLGMVSPAEFIPVAEEAGLIVPLGEWVLRTACNQARAWSDAGTPMRVAVNLSGRQFKEDDLVERVLAIVAEARVSPEWIELELTESTLMDAGLDTIEKLNALRSAGIQLSIDDFGTGYSSMSYLKRFPINVLKIDRTFIRDLPGDGEDAAITKAIIALAESLKIGVTAEGVETAAQARFLIDNGCHLCQGYYFSRPLPPEEISRIARAGANIRPA